jgi:hypothetical protein
MEGEKGRENETEEASRFYVISGRVKILVLERNSISSQTVD